jgi:ATP phosphoribosyltransferase regulatory subunit
MLASRNPLQLGAELYGHSGPDSDVEVISLMLATLDEVGVPGRISLDLGHVGVFSRLMQMAELTAQQQSDYQDMLQRKALPEIGRFVDELNLSAPLTQWLRELPRLNGGLAILEKAGQLFAADAELMKAVEYLADLAVRISARFPAVDTYFDLSELRGYHYHTGIVFAAYTPSFGQALAKGGRYDNIGRDFGRARPATGFSADLKTLMDLSGQLAGQAEGVILAPAGEAEDLQSAIASLRQAGKRVVQRLEGETDGDNRYCRQLVLDSGKWVLVDL